MAHAVIWCRVSTIKQEFESQKKELIKTALKDGFQEQDLIIIGEAGASAIKMNDLYQKEVDKLIETIDHNKSISCVYVWEVSRLARNKIAFQQMTAKLISNKIQLKCNVPQLKLLDDNGEVNNGMEITFDLLITLAKQEMEIKMKRFARGKERKASENKYNGGNIPYGYRVDQEHDNLIVEDDYEGKIVKLIYDLYENGVSQPKIAKELNDTGKAKIKISLINNILTNESYVGKRIKTKNASYKRAYPPIITQEQFDRCRQIAKNNNTTISKAKNIYYAEHLVRCSSCGAYWSATGSKASYHCGAAYKPASLWNYEYHKKERCNNKLSISINILDSILWHVAIEKEAYYREQNVEDAIQSAIREKDRIISILKNIEPRIKENSAKMERLQEMYIDGLSRDLYNKKRHIILEELNAIKKEEIKFKDELKHIQDSIIDLQARKKELSITISDIMDLMNGKINMDILEPTYPFIHAQNKIKIAQIADDAERYNIIHRQIKNAEILPRVIRYSFQNGEKDVKCKLIKVHTYLPSISEKEKEKTEGMLRFYAIPNGGNGPLILDTCPDEINEETPYLYDYEDGMEIPFEEISETIYLDRFQDVPKIKKRAHEREEKNKKISGKLSISAVAKKYGITYITVYNKIKSGKLKADFLYGQYYILPTDAEEYFNKIESTTKEKGMIGKETSNNYSKEIIEDVVEEGSSD